MAQQTTRCENCGYRVQWDPETREGPTVFFEEGRCPSCDRSFEDSAPVSRTQQTAMPSGETETRLYACPDCGEMCLSEGSHARSGCNERTVSVAKGAQRHRLSAGQRKSSGSSSRCV